MKLFSIALLPRSGSRA